MTTETPAPPAVITHMAAVLQALPAIGKNQRNTQQNFDFRGIDDVLNAVNPLLGEHGLVIVPDVQERTESIRTTSAGKALYVVNLHVRFTVFCAEDGSSLTGSAWGEGTDSGDKATNKAMTGAFKYFLFEAFAISTKEAADNDADRTTPPETDRQIFECPRCEEAGTHFEHIDRDKFRDHMVTKHGYWLLEDGRVAKPVTDAEQAPPADPPAEPKPAEVPDDGGRPVDPPTVDGPEVTRTLEEAVGFVSNLAKPQVVKMLGDAKLTTSGNLAALRTRLAEHLATVGQAPKAESGAEPSTPTVTSDAPQPTLEPAGDTASSNGSPKSSGNANLDGARKHGISTDLFIPDGQPHQCPECTAFPFDSEGEYQLHWYESHDPERETDTYTPPEEPAETAMADEAPPEPAGPEPAVQEDEDDGTPASEALIADIKAQIGALSGDGARAYARYRRENSVPPPAQLTFVQAIKLVDWLEANATAAV